MAGARVEATNADAKFKTEAPSLPLQMLEKKISRAPLSTSSSSAPRGLDPEPVVTEISRPPLESPLAPLESPPVLRLDPVAPLIISRREAQRFQERMFFRDDDIDDDDQDDDQPYLIRL